MTIKELITIAKNITVGDVLGAIVIFGATFAFLAVGG